MHLEFLSSLEPYLVGKAIYERRIEYLPQFYLRARARARICMGVEMPSYKYTSA